MAALFLPSRRTSQPGALDELNPAHPLTVQVCSAFLLNNLSVVRDAGPYAKVGTYVAASAACKQNARAGLVGTALGATNTGTNLQGYVTWGTALTQPPGYSFGTGDFWSMVVFTLDGYVNSGSSLNMLFGNNGDNLWSAGWGFYTDSTNKLSFDVGSVLSGSITATAYNDGRLHCAVGYRVGSTIYIVVDGIAATGVGSKSASVSSSTNYLNALNNGDAGFTARAWNGGLYAAAIGQGTITAEHAKALSRDPWNLWEPLRRQIWVDVVAGTTNASIAATDNSDTTAITAAATTGAAIAATDNSDTTAITAAATTGAAIAATDNSDTTAITAAATTGAAIAATDNSDTTAITADATGATNASISATESSDTTAIAAAATTGASIDATDSSDTTSIIAFLPSSGGWRGSGGDYSWLPKLKKRLRKEDVEPEVVEAVADAVQQLTDGYPKAEVKQDLKHALAVAGEEFRQEYMRIAEKVAEDAVRKYRDEQDDDDILMLLQ